MAELTLTIPDEIIARARDVAEQTGQPVEQVLVEQLSNGDTLGLASRQAEIAYFHTLSDEVVWAIAREQLALAARQRLQHLMDMADRDGLSDQDTDELAALNRLSDRLMLRKARAMEVLLDRGYSVTHESLGERD